MRNEMVPKPQFKDVNTYLFFEIEIIRELDWIKNCDNFYLNTHITGLNNLVKITLAMYFVDNITRLRSLFSFIP